MVLVALASLSLLAPAVVETSNSTSMVRMTKVQMAVTESGSSSMVRQVAKVQKGGGGLSVQHGKVEEAKASSDWAKGWNWAPNPACWRKTNCQVQMSDRMITKVLSAASLEDCQDKCFRT